MINKSAYILPITYWLQTRIKNLGNLLEYTLMYFGYLYFILALNAADSARNVFLFVVAWLSYISLYEIGYLFNDSWAQKREIEKGYSITKKALSISKTTFASLCVSRLSLSILCITYLHTQLTGAPLIFFFVILGSMVIAFALHNLILFPYRVVSFFILYLTRYSLILIFINKIDPEDITLILIICISYTISYFLQKSQLSKLSGNASFHIKLSLFITLLSIILFIVLQFDSPHTLLLGLAYLMIADLGFFCLRFFKVFYLACADNSILHVHTYYSHDCEMQIEFLSSISDRFKNKLYLTDHAEDFNYLKFASLKEEINKSVSNRLILGLEYPFWGQHILAFGLKQYVQFDEFSRDCFLKIKNSCDSLIWAHPHFAIRKLTSTNYLINLLYILRFVDGYELSNFKSTRGVHFAWRHFLLSMLGIYLFGTKKLTIGVDAHKHEDFEIYETFIKMSVPKKMIYCILSTFSPSLFPQRR